MEYNASELLWKDKKGKIRIKADEVFLKIYPNVDSTQIDQVSKQIRELVITISKKEFGAEPSSGSLNNCSEDGMSLVLFLTHMHQLLIKEKIYTWLS